MGYTATQLRLDQYPLAKLQGHTGTLLEAEVVATFLPSEVVDSLNAVVRRAGLETASLTLEPIAALNAAIPPQLRLLNLGFGGYWSGHLRYRRLPRWKNRYTYRQPWRETKSQRH